jgi:hypothetical protein
MTKQSMLLLVALACGACAHGGRPARADAEGLVRAVRASCVASTRNPDDGARILASIPKLSLATARVREWHQLGVSFELQRPPNLPLAQLSRFLGSWGPAARDHDRAERLPSGEEAREAQLEARLPGADGRECSLWARYVNRAARDEAVVELQVHVVEP